MFLCQTTPQVISQLVTRGTRWDRVNRMPLRREWMGTGPVWSSCVAGWLLSSTVPVCASSSLSRGLTWRAFGSLFPLPQDSTVFVVQLDPIPLIFPYILFCTFLLPSFLLLFDALRMQIYSLGIFLSTLKRQNYLLGAVALNVYRLKRTVTRWNEGVLK